MDIPAPGGGESAGADGLLIRKPRLSKMNVDINETGKHNGMMKINGNSARSVQPPGNGNNTAIRNGNINRTEALFCKQ